MTHHDSGAMLANNKDEVDSRPDLKVVGGMHMAGNNKEGKRRRHIRVSETEVYDRLDTIIGKLELLARLDERVDSLDKSNIRLEKGYLHHQEQIQELVTKQTEHNLKMDILGELKDEIGSLRDIQIDSEKVSTKNTTLLNFGMGLVKWVVAMLISFLLVTFGQYMSEVKKDHNLLEQENKMLKEQFKGKP